MTASEACRRESSGPIVERDHEARVRALDDRGDERRGRGARGLGPNEALPAKGSDVTRARDDVRAFHCDASLSVAGAEPRRCHDSVAGVEEPGGGSQGDCPDTDTDAECDVGDDELVAECVTRRLITRGGAAVVQALGVGVAVERGGDGLAVEQDACLATSRPSAQAENTTVGSARWSSTSERV